MYRAPTDFTPTTNTCPDPTLCRSARLRVERAGPAVDADEEGLVAERLDVLDELLRHEPRHLVHALVGLEEGAQVDRAVQDRVEVGDVADALALGQRTELLFQLPGRQQQDRKSTRLHSSH